MGVCTFFEDQDTEIFKMLPTSTTCIISAKRKKNLINILNVWESCHFMCAHLKGRTITTD
jgi:hypothetical protein